MLTIDVNKTMTSLRPMLVHIICLTMFLCLIVPIAGYADSNNVDFKKLNILSKFSDRKSAEELVYSLKKSGQKVRIVEKEIDLPLKSLSVGLFLTRQRADAVVRQLQKNHIDAFVFQLKNGKFRVHAGAMQDETNFWQRYEKLMALGYKKPHTGIKVVKIKQYYVVSDKKEKTKLLAKIKPVTTKTKNAVFTTELHNARFKGEFSIWGDQGNRSSSNYFNAGLSLRTKYKSNLDFTYGSRFDATEQSSDENVQKFETQWLPTYLRYHNTKQQWMIGAIDARWDTENNKTPINDLSDWLSSRILTRYKLDRDIIDRRRPVFGVRWTLDTTQFDLDVIWLPTFRPAKLPDFGSIWHPVRRSDGAIRGIKSTDTWKELVKQGSFANESFDTGGGGVRFLHKIGKNKRAITLQYARRNEPYYVLNPAIKRYLAEGQTLEFAMAAEGYTFTPKHPYSGVITWEESGSVSHFEVALFSNTPYTTSSYEYKTAMSMAWKMGFIYPKTNKRTHVSAYFIGRHINTSDSILDRKTKLALAGELYKISRSKLWKLGTRYEIGLDNAELFLNPRVTFQQSKYVQIYLNYLLFSGSEVTESGYHTNHSILSLTWQAAF